MAIPWAPFVDLIRSHQRFLLTTHVRPDGDGIGSILALGEVLAQLGKQVRYTCASSVPHRYAFLDPEGRIEHFQPPGEPWADVMLVLDTGTWNQLAEFGPYLKSHPGPRAVIDHHLTQDDLGALRLVDTTAEATGRLAFEAIRALGGQLTPRSASALFTALAMDTGWFRHSNTRPATFTLAAELVEAGARPEVLYELLFEQSSLPRLKLIGLVLDRMRVEADGQIAWTEIHAGDYAATGALPQDSEDLINYTRSIKGVEIGLLFMEQLKGGIKVSFRARAKADVGKLAEQFAGGGHRLASGATVEEPLAEVRRKVIAAAHHSLLAIR